MAALWLPAGASARSTLVDVPVSGRLDVAALVRLGLDVTEDVTPRRARVLLRDAADARRLRRAGWTYRVVVRDVDAASRRRVARASSSPALPSGHAPRYRVLDEYVSELAALASAHPGLVQSVTLPERSVEGRPITGVELASNVNRDDDGRPVFVVLGLHHAREWPSGEVALEFAHDLARGYGTSARITALLDRVRVLVVPVVNPDGYVASRGDDPAAAGGVDEQRRRNCAATTPAEEAMPCMFREGVDLNRNYAAGWGGVGAGVDRTSETYRGPAPFSEPESRAVHELLQRRQVTGVQSLHTIVAQVLRQPGFRDYGPEAPDEARMRELGDRLGAVTGYQSLHGYELYDVNGAAEDWNYIAQGAYGYTVELGPASDSGTNPVFHGPFQTAVVDQYYGGSASGRGMREALLLGAEAAGDLRDHALVAGSAPAGSVLRLRRSFRTSTVAICTATGCATRTPPQQLDDFVETTLTVGASGKFTWHIGPSTRPWIGRDGTREAWTLSCTPADATSSSAGEAPSPSASSAATSELVVVGRGQTARVSPCTPGDSPAVSRTAGILRVSVGAPRLRASPTRAVVVPVSVSGGVLRSGRLRLIDRRRHLVASRSFGRLAGERTLHVPLRAPLGPGRYRLVLRGTATDGAKAGDTARLVVSRR